MNRIPVSVAYSRWVHNAAVIAGVTGLLAFAAGCAPTPPPPPPPPQPVYAAPPPPPPPMPRPVRPGAPVRAGGELG